MWGWPTRSSDPVTCDIFGPDSSSSSPACGCKSCKMCTTIPVKTLHPRACVGIGCHTVLKKPSPSPVSHGYFTPPHTHWGGRQIRCEKCSISKKNDLIFFLFIFNFDEKTPRILTKKGGGRQITFWDFTFFFKKCTIFLFCVFSFWWENPMIFNKKSKR